MATDESHFAWTIGPDDAGERLDRFLAARGVLGTRSQVHRLIAAGAVRVGDRAVKPGTVLRSGDEITVYRPAPSPVETQPEPIPLDVLYEDSWLLAINKPPGLVVHPAPGHRQGTLVSALLYRWPEPGAGLDPARLGIVHRLDKDTSGVMLIARTAAALADLGRQFRAREVHKQYLALVCGAPRAHGGLIDRPIARHPIHRQRMAVRACGRAARTRYEVVERFRGITLVRAYPETGRTHQIRLHLAAQGHPVLGDRLYGHARPGDAGLISRQALHAEAIAFRHPVTGDELRLEAPLAADFAATLARLGATSLTSPGAFTSVPPVSAARHDAG
ncbi:MAG: RluA family pseudouridine synthase [Candidatus Binatia bacterium]